MDVRLEDEVDERFRQFREKCAHVVREHREEGKRRERGEEEKALVRSRVSPPKLSLLCAVMRDFWTKILQNFDAFFYPKVVTFRPLSLYIHIKERPQPLHATHTHRAREDGVARCFAARIFFFRVVVVRVHFFIVFFLLQN